MFCTAQCSRFSSNYFHCRCRRNPCPGFQSGQDSRRYPRHNTLIWCTHLTTFKILFLLRPCTRLHPPQPHTGLLQEHCRFSRWLSPRLCQFDPREILVKNVSRLQRLQSTLARVDTCQRGCISISKTLQELDWLPIKWKIDHKVATLTYQLLQSG